MYFTAISTVDFSMNKCNCTLSSKVHTGTIEEPLQQY